jgi:hypothetical protein
MLRDVEGTWPILCKVGQISKVLEKCFENFEDVAKILRDYKGIRKTLKKCGITSRK